MYAVSGCLKTFAVIMSRIESTARNDEFPARKVLSGSLKRFLIIVIC
ncbi:MAG: hypothetical protein J6W29_10110 [Neisseriaceae bacterium]|nr:hypothetical protein [Neisseriaceae bacterium]